MLRAIREVQPRWVVAENVRGLITQQGGVVFEQVCASMEALGYEVQPFILPACAVNAPHRRDRVWIVAHRADARDEEMRERQDGVYSALDASDTKSHGDSGRSGQKGCENERQNGECNAEFIEHGCVQAGFVADPESAGLQGGIEKQREAESRRGYTGIVPISFDRFPTESPVCSGDDGLSSRLDAITFPKWREQSIKAYGNAVVPHVVYQIFRTIEDYEKVQ